MNTSHPQREDQWHAKSKLAWGWLRMADVGLRPFLLHRQETEERSVSRQTWGTSCFCTRGRTISESHCRSVISVMLSNVKEASRPHQLSSASCTSVTVWVSVHFFFPSLTRAHPFLCLQLSYCVIHSHNGTNLQDKPPLSVVDSAFSVTEEAPFKTPILPLPNASAANQFWASSGLAVSLCS